MLRCNWASVCLQANMKIFGVLFAIMALVLAVVCSMSTGAHPAGLKENHSAGCNGRGGPPPPPPTTTAATTTTTTTSSTG